MDSILWSVLEPTTTFLIACMPSIRLVFRTKMPAYREALSTAVPSLARRKGSSLSYDHAPAAAAGDEHHGVAVEPSNTKSRVNSPSAAAPGHSRQHGISPV